MSNTPTCPKCGKPTHEQEIEIGRHAIELEIVHTDTGEVECEAPQRGTAAKGGTG